MTNAKREVFSFFFIERLREIQLQNVLKVGAYTFQKVIPFSHFIEVVDVQVLTSRNFVGGMKDIFWN